MFRTSNVEVSHNKHEYMSLISDFCSLKHCYKDINIVAITSIEESFKKTYIKDVSDEIITSTRLESNLNSLHFKEDKDKILSVYDHCIEKYKKLQQKLQNDQLKIMKSSLEIIREKINNRIYFTSDQLKNQISEIFNTIKHHIEIDFHRLNLKKEKYIQNILDVFNFQKEQRETMSGIYFLDDYYQDLPITKPKTETKIHVQDDSVDESQYSCIIC